MACPYAAERRMSSIEGTLMMEEWGELPERRSWARFREYSSISDRGVGMWAECEPWSDTGEAT